MGETTRYKIFITEAIWVLWKARNTRTFEGIQINIERTYLRWVERMTDRIEDEFEQIKLNPYKEREELQERFERRWCIKKRLATVIKTTALTLKTTVGQ